MANNVKVSDNGMGVVMSLLVFGFAYVISKRCK